LPVDDEKLIEAQRLRMLIHIPALVHQDHGDLRNRDFRAQLVHFPPLHELIKLIGRQFPELFYFQAQRLMRECF
jgi:hypothetical protein